MKNVYDLKKDNNLNFVLPKEIQTSEIKITDFIGRVLVIIHLHYLDTVENYIPYIEAIPFYADIIITASDYNIGKIIEEKTFSGKERCKIIYKQNRGRDISSFLVTCRTEILKYEYICFVHDKKAKSEELKEDTDKWIHCLWENSLASITYVNNILLTFVEYSNLGVLVPPPPIGEHLRAAYKNSWGSNFEMMLQLSKKLELNCDLRKDKSPITIGTVFWARVAALKKLFEYAWRYEDFDDEPLQKDGTLSHAIERCFAYVAQDSGYETGWVMTDQFVGERLQYMETVLQHSLTLLGSAFGVRYIDDLNSFDEKGNELINFCRERKNVYIYGAGKCAKRCILFANYFDIEIRALLVTDKSDNKDSFQGYPVVAIDEENISSDSGIIIAVSQQYQQHILQKIHEKCNGQENIYIFK